MDLVAHALWAVAGAVAVSRPPLPRPGMLGACAAAALAPDLVHVLPHLGWALAGDGGLGAVIDYVRASPGEEPAVPAAVAAASHHLHCIGHSAVVAAPATLLLRAWLRVPWLPLLAWWSHILIDVVSHSADFYPSPVLYPLSPWAFDGWAWNTPLFTALNYLALACVAAALRWRRRGPAGSAGQP